MRHSNSQELAQTIKETAKLTREEIAKLYELLPPDILDFLRRAFGTRYLIKGIKGTRYASTRDPDFQDKIMRILDREQIKPIKGA